MDKTFNALKSFYFRELLAYLCWFRGVSRESGGDNPLSWDSHNHECYLKRSGELIGMEKIIGLSEEEKTKILAEAEGLIGPLKK